MDHAELLQKAQDLSDIELAILTTLIANEHCSIQTTEEALPALGEEVKTIATKVFGLSCSILDCSDSTTLEDFSRSTLIERTTKQRSTSLQNSSRRASAFTFERSYSGDLYEIAQVFVVKSIGSSSHQIQMQALELLRTHRIFTHTGLYSVPKTFIMVLLSANSSPPLAKHLNDFIFISHVHDVEDGFVNLEEQAVLPQDVMSSTSPWESHAVDGMSQVEPLITPKDISQLSAASNDVVISVDVQRYIHDVLTFLRFHRAVVSGVSPRATKHLRLLLRCLAPLHGLNFVTPSLVALAAHKIYAHRLTLTEPEQERSMQYGSDSTAVAELLKDSTVDSIIEDAILEVDVPP